MVGLSAIPDGSVMLGNVMLSELKVTPSTVYDYGTKGVEKNGGRIMVSKVHLMSNGKSVIILTSVPKINSLI